MAQDFPRALPKKHVCFDNDGKPIGMTAFIRLLNPSPEDKAAAESGPDETQGSESGYEDQESDVTGPNTTTKASD